ncbi:lantibiotic dehydratase C-terminal domain-containing protein [Streptacidiphilus sp. PAMC 29251]
MNHVDAPTPPQEPVGEWQALHVFYAASSRPLIVDCLEPLIDSLCADGLLAGYFFINYWVEGPHVRLRLKPARVSLTDEVNSRAEAAVQAYLRRRPALYDTQSEFGASLYETLFELEFSPEEREQFIAPDGRMLLRPNNTYSREPYEPEYGKYGGPAGVALAEWHFQRSTDLVVRANQTMNLHLRPVLLGLSAQLMMVMTTAFLPGEAASREYLQSYHDFWSRSFSSTEYIRDTEYNQAYDQMGDRVAVRFSDLRRALASGDGGRLPEILAEWYAHSLDLLGRITELAERGALEFRSWTDDRQELVTDPLQAALRLLSPYLHMTNNRLYVTLDDEAYLSQVLARGLVDADRMQDTR